MRVLVDAERLRNLNTGLGQFCKWLGEGLLAARPPHAEISFLVPPYRRGIFGAESTYENAAWWRKAWSAGRYDVWHATHQDSTFRPSRGARVVLTIQDLNFLERPDYSARKKRRRLAAVQRRVDRAAVVVATSEYTASVLRERLVMRNTPLHVIPLGNPSPPDAVVPGSVDRRIVERVGDEPFLLFVGVVHPKKNVHSLVDALVVLPHQRLVVAGPDGHPYAAFLREQAARARVDERVAILGAVDDATKRWLLQRSTAFVFPSLAEGFGLPVVEAMSFGKPVFVSRLTSLPEIAGPDAYYFDSFAPAAMAEALRVGIADFAAHPARADRLRARAALFTWDRVARDYWSLYASVAAI